MGQEIILLLLTKVADTFIGIPGQICPGWFFRKEVGDLGLWEFFEGWIYFPTRKLADSSGCKFFLTRDWLCRYLGFSPVIEPVTPFSGDPPDAASVQCAIRESYGACHPGRNNRKRLRYRDFCWLWIKDVFLRHKHLMSTFNLNSSLTVL